MPIDAPDLRLLFERHSESLLRFAGGRTLDPDDAVAETFLRAYRSMPIDLIDDEPGQRAWLFRVLRNITISAARRRSVADRYLREHSQLSPHRPTTESETDVDLHGQLAILPERQRVVLELRFVHDLDVEAVAEVLGMSLEATRALTYRALSQLRRSVNDLTTTTPGPDTT